MTLSKLSNLMHDFAKKSGKSFGDTRRFFQKRIAALELVPYHLKESARIRPSVLNALLSVDLVRSFVWKELLPRAKAGEILLVVTRGVKKWGLPSHRNIILYSGPEARSAHLTPKSRGEVLRFLLGTSKPEA